MAAADDLVFTIAIGPPGSLHETMARMLVSSLQATGFEGTIIVIVGPSIAFARSAPPNVIAIPVPDTDEPMSWKYRSRALFDAARYRRVLYLDCDCLAIADIRPLLDGDWDLAYVPEYGTSRSLTYFNGFLRDDELSGWGVNAGTFAVRGDAFADLMETWERITTTSPARPLWRKGSDQPAWNRLVLDTSLVTHAFDEGVVRLPLVARRPPPRGVVPRIVHFAGVRAEMQLQRMSQTYFEVFGVR